MQVNLIFGIESIFQIRIQSSKEIYLEFSNHLQTVQYFAKPPTLPCQNQKYFFDLIYFMIPFSLPFNIYYRNYSDSQYNYPFHLTFVQKLHPNYIDVVLFFDFIVVTIYISRTHLCFPATLVSLSMFI